MCNSTELLKTTLKMTYRILSIDHIYLNEQQDTDAQKLYEHQIFYYLVKLHFKVPTVRNKLHLRRTETLM